MREFMDRCRTALAIIVAFALLAGCASKSANDEDRVGSFLVSPGKYEFYTCAHLAQMTVAYTTREKELEALIAKAGTDAGGRLASAVAYSAEHSQARGNLVELRKTATAKNCPPPVVETPAKPTVIAKPKKR
jgi:hypothetical protein